jgi:hypothetical protein
MALEACQRTLMADRQAIVERAEIFGRRDREQRLYECVNIRHLVTLSLPA